MQTIRKSSIGFEAALTKAQLKVLQSILPRGFSLQLIDSSAAREKTPQPRKKQIKADGTFKKHPKNESKSKSAPKRAAAGKKVQRTHIETKYNDIERYSKGKKPKTLSDGLKKSLSIVQKLKKNPNAYPFLYPVDKYLVPDYYEKIIDPMDLSKLEKNLRNGFYSSTLEFASDVRKIWNNAFIYNDEGSKIFHMTKQMSIYFEEIFQDVENVALPNNNAEQLQRQIGPLTGLFKKLCGSNGQTNIVKSPVASIASQKASKSTLDKPMTLQEKHQLVQMIRDLPQEYLRGVFQIVSDALPDSGTNNEAFEFDLDLLPVRKVRELERYVKARHKTANKTQSKKKTTNKKGQANNAGHGQDLYDTVQPQPQYHPTQQPYPQDLEKNDDIDSLSRESSFITDSDDSDDDEKRRNSHQKKI